MNSSNKNIREQRTARTIKLKSKLDATTQQIQQLNHKYFEIPLPQHYHTDHQPVRPTHHHSQSQVEKTGYKEVDPRKENIKQKIKFRVKQELWNILKKNN